jgi:hypothetical protein
MFITRPEAKYIRIFVIIINKLSQQVKKMKVVAINGSPHKTGNTYHALKIVGSKLEENGIEFEIIHVGNKAVRGCMACGSYRRT